MKKTDLYSVLKSLDRRNKEIKDEMDRREKLGKKSTYTRNIVTVRGSQSVDKLNDMLVKKRKL